MSRFHFLVFSLCVFLVGCGGSFAAKQSLIQQMTSATKELADLLETVQDKSTAQAAAPMFRTLVERAEKLGQRIEDLDAQPEDMGTDPEFAEVVGLWIAEQSRLMQEQLRVSKIPGATEALGEPWQRLTGGVFDPGGILAPGGTMDLGKGAKP
ncbi:MAG: hypothetical protein ACR2FY_13490 [Pirellulaceae bacterium]